MAEPISSDARPRASWRARLAGAGLIALGLGGVAVGISTVFDAWSTGQSWQTSPEARELEREAAEPTPAWLPSATPEPTVELRPLPSPVVVAGPSPVPASGPVAFLAPGPVVERTAPVDQLSLANADFRFLDPPEPGAHARLAFDLANGDDVPSEPILLGIPSAWFQSYSIIGTAPAVTRDQTEDDGTRTFSFSPVPASTTIHYELHVTVTAETTAPPAISLRLNGGDVIGEAAPKTLAPTPRPGPVMSIDVPRLKLKTGVVQVAWEPPPFAVGQIKTTAHITQGNTVLVGHLRGAAGNVFDHLDQLKPGDEVTAVSRGLPYKFVVSQIFTGSNTDSTPVDAAPEEDSRLTLMTCAGLWNPLTHDYSQRLWVIAEPPERAAETIVRVAATATAQSALDAAATATAFALIPTPEPTPTPYVGEPSLAGGLGNTRSDVGRALGAPKGETQRKLVVFRQGTSEMRVGFTPDPPRESFLVEVLPAPVSFDAAVRESRRFFPMDAEPRANAPEGNSEFVVERFSSPSLAAALGNGDFSVIYVRDGQAKITSIILGLGDDYTGLMEQSLG